MDATKATDKRATKKKQSHEEITEDCTRLRPGMGDLMQKAARKGRNPKTGGELIIEARKVVAFKPSTKLREKIN